MTLKLLIAEDNRDVADAVAYGARVAWPDCEVEIAEDGARALRYFEEHAPDLVILDVSMPPPDGLEVCRRIRRMSRVPILMLTVHDATLDKVRALDLGADDYLTKPFDFLELLARMRALLRRSHDVAQEAGSTFIAGDLCIDFNTREVRLRGEIVPLTSTEYRLLGELIRHPGTVLPHQLLLDRVWGADWVADVGYLKVFVSRLRHKLGDDAQHPQYIQTEWGVGYRFAASSVRPS
jgi:two-component system KDP operon response regulator KdpE